MPIKSPKELFGLLLTNVRQSAQRETAIFQELSKLVQDTEIKEALDARIFLSEKNMSILDECFRLIGQEPMKVTGRIHDVMVDELRKELTEIQSPIAKHLFVLAKAQQLIHFRMGEFITLIAAANMTGDYGVSVLLESCLADKVAFVERARHLVKHVIESKAAGKLAA
jgi:ferritin-like metal-binding protein YciE